MNSGSTFAACTNSYQLMKPADDKERRMKFSEKVVIVTGGGGGLGMHLLERFSGEGATIVLVDLDTEMVERQTAVLIERTGLPVLGLACDVTSEEDLDLVMRTIASEFGRIDVLVNGAALHGQKYNQPFSVLDRREIRAMLDVNVMGVINASLASRPHMVAGSAIINLASASGHSSATPYGVSKLAVRGVTLALATEFAEAGIRVNAVSPGFIDTFGGLTQRTREQRMAIIAALGTKIPAQVLDECTSDQLIDIILSQQLIKHQGTPEDITEAVFYLASSVSGFITGETLKVAGGALSAF